MEEEQDVQKSKFRNERYVWLGCVVVAALIVTPPLGIILLLVATGAFFFYKKPNSIHEGVRMFFCLPKKTKTIIGGLLGAIVGSFMGIAYMGNAVSGTIPIAVLMAYLVHVNTDDKS